MTDNVKFKCQTYLRNKNLIRSDINVNTIKTKNWNESIQLKKTPMSLPTKYDE